MSQTNLTDTEIDSNDRPIVLSGAIAIEASLLSGNRQVTCVWIDEALDHRKVEPVRRAAKSQRVEMRKVSRDTLDALAGDAKHGGIVAEVGPRQFVEMSKLLEIGGKKRAFLVMLDGIEDPFNFGQAVRSLYAAGCSGVVVRPRNWTMAPGGETTIARASAGATEMMPMAIAESPEEAAAYYKQQGVSVIAATDARDATPLYEASFSGPILLLIGGEKRGLKSAVVRSADQRVAIPYARPFGWSLGTVAATSVLAFEIARQRAPRH